MVASALISASRDAVQVVHVDDASSGERHGGGLGKLRDKEDWKIGKADNSTVGELVSSNLDIYHTTRLHEYGVQPRCDTAASSLSRSNIKRLNQSPSSTRRVSR